MCVRDCAVTRSAYPLSHNQSTISTFDSARFRPQHAVRGVNAPIKNADFISAIQSIFQISFDGNDRVFHSHGAILQPPIPVAFLHSAIVPPPNWFLNSYSRLFASGHTCDEIFALRHDEIRRIADAVVWPENHEQAVTLVEAASTYNVCLIPFGGKVGGFCRYLKNLWGPSSK